MALISEDDTEGGHTVLSACRKSTSFHLDIRDKIMGERVGGKSYQIIGVAFLGNFWKMVCNSGKKCGI